MSSTDRDNDQIKREEGVHGRHWNTVHGGYFSDPAIADPLVRKIRALAGQSKPDAIVDLGGGTGFLLAQLLAAGVGPGVSLVNLDNSDVQLDTAKEAGFACVRGSVDSFSRRDAGAEEGRFLFIMRSVLHYFGEAGLDPVLRHVRAQARPGEFYVHQTASFGNEKDAACLNELYAMMGTPKWYPTVDCLRRRLDAEGWQVLEVLPAPPLRLASGELLERYQLDPADIPRIAGRLSLNDPVSEKVFKKTDDGFCAFLHYWIYVCAAKPVKGPSSRPGA